MALGFSRARVHHAATMTDQTNELGQPIGFPVPDWQPRPAPPRTAMQGRTCRVEPLDPNRHAADLHEANCLDAEGRNWTYMGYGPFASLDDYLAWMKKDALGDDPLFHAIIDTATEKAVGVATYLRIEPKTGVIETGHICYSPPLQRTVAATEAMYLMMARVFDELGYRRYEWKCDALNAPSRAAAKRLGFQYEGIFRQATMYKGRNRDTAWYAITDQDWPALKATYAEWLAPENFDNDGRQRQSLSAMVAASR